MKDIKEPEDIKDLGWRGNFADDAPLFDAVNDYIRREPDLKKRQEAEHLANLLGMGMDVYCAPNEDPRDWIGDDEGIILK